MIATESHRERLYDAFADPEGDEAEQITRALDVGRDYLDLPIGFFTRIDDGVQEIVHAVGDHHLIQPGETCPLEKAYCRRTIERDSPLAVHTATTDSVIERRAVDTFGLGTYIGARVTVDGEVYGTVCFAARDERDEPFAEAETVFLELLARLAGSAVERRRHEQELRERNEALRREKRRFEGIAETSTDILFRVGLDATFTYVSSAADATLGYAPADLVGNPFTDYMTDEGAARGVDAYERLLDRGTVQNLELDFLDADGTVVVLEVNATPIVTAGEVTGIQGVGRDVTERKERERELRLKNRAMDEARIGISIADVTAPDQPLVYANEGFTRLTGYDTDAAVGSNCRFLQGEATDPASVGRLRSAIDAGESVAVDLVNYRTDGTPFWNEVRLAPIVDDARDLTHYLGFQADVTDRKRTAQLIRVLNRVLRHNLRNDMNAVLGWASVIEDGGDAAEASRRITDLAGDLVATSERARELEQYATRDRRPARLDPARVIDDAIMARRDEWPDATVEARIETERDACAGPELSRAVGELTANALEHGGGPPVSVTCRADGDWLEFVVADDGPGIEAMEAAVVEAGSETALQHGSGLGLWLVNWIVTRYGGSFDIDGTEAGTTATVRVPAIDDETSVAEATRPPAVLFS